jgi:FtsH-binding integral membrane protein
MTVQERIDGHRRSVEIEFSAKMLPLIVVITLVVVQYSHGRKNSGGRSGRRVVAVGVIAAIFINAHGMSELLLQRRLGLGDWD